MGLMDQINKSTEEQVMEREAQIDRRRRDVLSKLMIKLDFDELPEPKWVEQIEEKSYSRFDAKTKFFEVVKIDDLVLHCEFSQLDWNIYIPEVCISCRKMDRLQLSVRGGMTASEFTDQVAKTLAYRKVSLHERCWDCHRAAR